MTKKQEILDEFVFNIKKHIEKRGGLSDQHVKDYLSEIIDRIVKDVPRFPGNCSDIVKCCEKCADVEDWQKEWLGDE